MFLKPTWFSYGTIIFATSATLTTRLKAAVKCSVYCLDILREMSRVGTDMSYQNLAKQLENLNGALKTTYQLHLDFTNSH